LPPTIPSEIEWSRLSDRGAAILRQVALPYAAGCSTLEIGRSLGISGRSASNLLDELADELEQLG
jgi:DNA-binding CsgD family transcriptional regulator